MLLLKPGWLLRLEGLAALVISCWLYKIHGGGWGMFALLFLVPDVSILPYLAGKRVGAACYNMVHSYTLALALAAAGVGYGHGEWVRWGMIWVAHIGFDRVLGFGLKYAEAFQPTHLQRV